ncbi:uncharacterized protein CBL_10328 [Carabus blaptoides fortunei]
MLTAPAVAWDSDQLEIFDLVEEINQNFYTVFNISQDAELPAIKKAFRSLSLVLHPDKNDAPDAEVQFRNIVAIYDVLKDPSKREHYNEVLKNGLPNWKSAVYYYRHVRKMGLAETLLTLFIVLTIGQYFVSWAAYIEKKYTAEQVYGAKMKKQQKKKGQVSAEIIEKFDIPKPSFMNTLPIQIPRLLWASIIGIPTAICYMRQLYNERLEQRKLEQEEYSSEEEPVERVRTVKRRKVGFVPTERADSELPPQTRNHTTEDNGTKVRTPASIPVSGGLWTDDDLAELIQLVKRYPGGTTERWERIGDAMNRSVSEVTYMAAKLKDNCYRLPGQTDESKSADDELQVSKKQKTRGGKLGSAEEETAGGTVSSKGPVDTSWGQVQQKALEGALAKYPKGPTDRWEKIAKCVPDKTKEECMLRYKYLVELVKKQKEKKESPDAEEQ